MTKVDESAFTPMFLASLSVLELAKLQHGLRQFPEDRKHLDAVLQEFKRREAEARQARGTR